MKIRTEEQLLKLRKKAIKKILLENNYNKRIEFTCDDCAVRNRCRFAYDVYNTDDDCLAMK